MDFFGQKGQYQLFNFVGRFKGRFHKFALSITSICFYSNSNDADVFPITRGSHRLRSGR